MKELETIVASRDDTMAAQDKAFLVYQRDIERCKAAAVRVVGEYKFSKTFQEEVMKVFEKAFDCRFTNYKSLVKKIFLDLDLSSLTQEAVIQLISETPA